MPHLEESIRDFAQTLGFALSGIAPATEADGFHRLQEWLAQGFSGEMAYMNKHAAARRHPESVLPGVRSVIMVAMDYAQSETPDESTGRQHGVFGKVARYAAGEDYHHVMWRKLDKLIAWLQTERPGCRARGVVDTAPLMERDFARRAGLGWIGKNTMLINKQRGSYFLLGALLTDLELSPSRLHVEEHCGTCTACLDACPTQAFAAPGMLDARRCISYLTIELRGPIPEDLRPGIGDWVFGCDVCQEVCPWNHPDATRPAKIDALELLALSGEEYRQRFGGRALTRPKHSGLRRNACMVLGNAGDPTAVPALRQALQDEVAMVREAAGWAIAQIEAKILAANQMQTH